MKIWWSRKGKRYFWSVHHLHVLFSRVSTFWRSALSFHSGCTVSFVPGTRSFFLYFPLLLRTRFARNRYLIRPLCRQYPRTRPRLRLGLNKWLEDRFLRQQVTVHVVSAAHGCHPHIHLSPQLWTIHQLHQILLFGY